MRYLLIFCLLVSKLAFTQAELANDYYTKGQFDKALVLYKKLESQNQFSNKYKQKIIDIYRQLEQLDQAEQYIKTILDTNNNPVFLIEMGYNYQLKQNPTKAYEYYDLADQKLNDNVNYAYMLARTYEQYSLLDRAIHVYKTAMELNPALRFNIQLARIYGEQGDIQKMFNSYLGFIQTNPIYIDNAKRAISDFISEDGNNENNILFKKTLLKKIQQEPNLLWNELLSWLFIQQKDYDKAFAQEKAIFKRQPKSLNRIMELALITIDEQRNETAKDILTYLTETAQDIDTKIKANNYLIKLETQEVSNGNYRSIETKYQDLFNTFGVNNRTLDLQLSYAQFLAFKSNNPEAAIVFLKETLKLPLSQFQQADVKLKLGDILVYQEKFNEALIYYTQIQQALKNSTVAQEARFRIAKTSYYKGDFDWAESQLKILKASTSQLIANDALDLKLLISDNKYEDSTQSALKRYAKADFLAYQNKTQEAINVLNEVLKDHKGETIEDQALFLQAKLFEKQHQYIKAEANYNLIITNYKFDILADDALYRLAELYNNQLNQTAKAKALYEQILFNHQDSIYFVEARKKFRALRGDSIN